MFVGVQDVQDILGFETRKMAVTFYVYSSPDESDKDFRIRLNRFNDAVVREIEKYGGIDRNVKATAKNLENVRNALSRYLWRKRRKRTVYSCQISSLKS